MQCDGSMQTWDMRPGTHKLDVAESLRRIEKNHSHYGRIVLHSRAGVHWQQGTRPAVTQMMDTCSLAVADPPSLRQNDVLQ